MRWVVLSTIGIAFLFMLFMIGSCTVGEIQFESKIGYAWSLADKSSTLSEKSKYIDEYILNLKDSKHADYSNPLWQTRNNEWGKNIKALESLGERLKKIQGIDEQSFAYQTAIQQITQQEQGEAEAMLSVLKNCWFLENGFFFAVTIIAIIFHCGIWGFIIITGMILAFKWDD